VKNELTLHSSLLANYKCFKYCFKLNIEGLGYTRVIKIRYFADYEFLKIMCKLEHLKLSLVEIELSYQIFQNL